MKPPPPLRVTVMPNRTANYRGYAIEGEMNDQGWSVEVHPRGPDFPILRQSAFWVRHPSWNSALAEATSRVDAVLDGQLDPAPKLPSALEEVFNSAWNIVASTSRVLKARPNVHTQLQLALARCIVALAANGITDPTELRRQAVERILLGEAVNSSSGSSSLVAQ